MDATGSLVRWDLPFAVTPDPSVSVITDRGGDIVTLVIAREGLGTYPQHLVRFEKAVALLYYEEAFAFDRGYRTLPGFDASVSAYRWLESPWIHAYRRGKDVFRWPDLQHYIILGGDSIVEIVAASKPMVQRVDASTAIHIEHQI